MRATYENNTKLGAGHGLLVLHDIHVDATTSLGFGIRRSNDGRYLGKNGWQDAEEPLWPDAIGHAGDGALVLSVSPHVVNQLDELIPYRCILYSKDGQSLGMSSLSISGVIYSNMAQSAVVNEYVPPVVAKPEPQVQAQPEPQPQIEPTQEPQNPPERSSFGKWLVLLLVGLALIALGIWLWFGSDMLKDKVQDAATAPQTTQEQESEPQSESGSAPNTEQDSEQNSEQDPTVNQEEKTDLEPSTGLNTPPSSAPESKPDSQPIPAPAPVKSPKEQVYAFMREAGDAKGATSLAASLPSDTVEGQDAIFLLMEYAAEKGNAVAMLRIANYYDPLVMLPSGTLQKDAEQAWQWYSKVIAQDNEHAATAQKAIADLKAWLIKQAEQGDASAQDLLRRVDPAP